MSLFRSFQDCTCRRSTSQFTILREVKDFLGQHAAPSPFYTANPKPRLTHPGQTTRGKQAGKRPFGVAGPRPLRHR